MNFIHNDISPNYPTLTPTLSLRERELVKCESSLPLKGRVRVGMGYNHDAIYVAVYNNISGYTLIEVLVAMTLAAVIFAGTLVIVQKIRAVDSGFEEIAGLYSEIGKINRMLREDLAGIEKSVNMEPFTDQIIDQKRDGFFDAGFFKGPLDPFDLFTPMDDLTTSGLPYAPAINRDESTGLPGNDPATPYDDSAVDAINLPYGPAYDYFFGITNNGLRDAFSFRGGVSW